MKNFKIYSLIVATALGMVISCKDDSLELVPEWESAVHGFAEVTSTNTDFLYNDPSQDIDYDLQWISIDRKLTVTKIEVYALFNENYIDQDGNPKVAAHGGAEGLLLETFEGSGIPANRTPLSLSVSQADLYDLYQDATFDYDGPGGNPAVDVFTYKPQRNATQRFMWDDAIRIRWEFTTDDGRVFSNWGISVCTEFPGANCSVDFGVVCSPTIEEPAGTWTFNLTDSYGDGWQGGYISVIIDGTESEQINIPDGGGSSLQRTVVVPGTATSLSFEWVEDTYNGECGFAIVSPKGNTVASVSNPAEGAIKLNLCLE